MAVDLRRLIDVLEPACRSSLEGAVSLAMTNGHATAGVGHWMQRLIEAGGPALAELARTVDPGRLLAELQTSLGREPRGSGAPALSPTLVTWVREAYLVASLQWGRHLVGELDLLSALLQEPTLRAVAVTAAPSLDRVSATAIAAAAEHWAGAGAGPAPRAPGAETALPEGDPLGKFTIDLTAQARAGTIDPVVGREGEIRQVIDILSRRRQNNPILVGEAGRGENRHRRGVCPPRGVSGDVPPALRDIAVRTLDLGPAAGRAPGRAASSSSGSRA